MRKVVLTASLLAALAACQKQASQAPQVQQALQDVTSVSPSSLHLTYVCDNTFQVTNRNAFAVPITWKLAYHPESGSLTLPAAPAGQVSTTQFSTQAVDTVRIYISGTLNQSMANFKQPCGGTPPPPPPPPPGGGSPGLGAWSPIIQWPVVAIHTHVLPNGRVLSWGHSGSPNVWDPATGSFTPAAEGVDIFCSGHSLLADGRLLVTGGNISSDHGLKDTFTFDWRTNAWTRGPDMLHGRWYPTNTALPDGEMLVTAGEDENGANNKVPEVWKTDGTFRELTSAYLDIPYYPWMFVVPDGRVFYAGMNAQSYWLDTSGTGKWTTGPRSAGGQREYGTAVMYEPGKILIAGGSRTPLASVEVIDVNHAAPKWRTVAPMKQGRRHAVSTLLPDGTVLITGGTSGAGKNNATGAVLAAELWNPASETFHTLGSMKTKRLYHSGAVLLPDARVLVAGGGQPNADGEPDHFDAEIFSPPYLFHADGTPAVRPTFTGAPAEATYGQALTLSSQQAIAQATLIRLSSTTHAYNQSQNFNRLALVKNADGTLSATMPASGKLAPPGPYQLFLLDSAGVPSVAAIVLLH